MILFSSVENGGEEVGVDKAQFMFSQDPCCADTEKYKLKSLPNSDNYHDVNYWGNMIHESV